MSTGGRRLNNSMQLTALRAAADAERWVKLPIMVIDAWLLAHREEILRIATQNGARDVRVFGSHATGRMHAGSDVDLLIDLELGWSLLDLVAVRQDQRSVPGCEVDVVTERSVSGYSRRQVLEEVILL